MTNEQDNDELCRTDIGSASPVVSGNLLLIPMIAISLLVNLIGATSMTLDHLSFSDFSKENVQEDTRFVTAVPIARHPKVKLNKFLFTLN